MNSVLSINKIGFGLKVNNNENYDFSVGGNKVLCLNKRLVEIGVGTCVAFSACFIYNSSRIELTGTPLFSFAAVGLASVVTVCGCQGLQFLLLLSAVLQIKTKGFTDGIDLYSLFILYTYSLFSIGGAAVFAGGICGTLVGFSYLVKKYGSAYVNELLDYFNNQQNIISLGAIDVKNNLEYQCSLFGRDILCLKRAVLQLGYLFGLALSIHTVFSMKQQNADSFMMLPEVIMGMFAVYKTLGRKAYIIPLLLLIPVLVNPSSYGMSCAWGFIISLIIGKGVVLTGIGFSALALLSYLVKKPGNKKLTKLEQILSKLQDKKKVQEYEKSIKIQRLGIEARREEIRVRDSIMNEAVDVNLVEDYKPKSDIVARSDEGPKVKVKRRPNNLDVDQGKEKDKGDIASKDAGYSVELPKKYKVNLKNHETTWNQLFDITKSKPDHYTIEGKDIETLIAALGGEVKKGSKKKMNICFAGKTLGHYEESHATATKGYLTAKFANRVKIAIEKAIKSGYIDESIVKVIL